MRLKLNVILTSHEYRLHIEGFPKFESQDN